MGRWRGDDHGADLKGMGRRRGSRPAMPSTRRAHLPSSAIWRTEADQVLGPGGVERRLATTFEYVLEPGRAPPAAWKADTSERVIGVLDQDRLTWQLTHIRAEARRQNPGVPPPSSTHSSTAWSTSPRSSPYPHRRRSDRRTGRTAQAGQSERLRPARATQHTSRGF